MPVDVRDKVAAVVRDVAEDFGVEGLADLDDDTELLDSGLDSIGWATVVTLLEEELGYDPFMLMEDPEYPTTFGRFVALYERYASHSRAAGPAAE